MVNISNDCSNTNSYHLSLRLNSTNNNLFELLLDSYVGWLSSSLPSVNQLLLWYKFDINGSYCIGDSCHLARINLLVYSLLVSRHVEAPTRSGRKENYFTMEPLKKSLVSHQNWDKIFCYASESVNHLFSNLTLIIKSVVSNGVGFFALTSSTKPIALLPIQLDDGQIQQNAQP